MISSIQEQTFETNLSGQETIQATLESMTWMESHALDWTPERDALFRGIQEQDMHILGATGTIAGWEFEFRFPSHETLSGFQRHCKLHDCYYH